MLCDAANSFGGVAADPAIKTKLIASTQEYATKGKEVLDSFLVGYAEGKSEELVEYLEKQKAKAAEGKPSAAPPSTTMAMAANTSAVQAAPSANLPKRAGAH